MTIQLMRGIQGILPFSRGCVATIGNFDGVHDGHQQLLKRLKMTANSLNLHALVITFEPLPKEYFAKDKGDRMRLMGLREKAYALAQQGVDQLLVLPFREPLANLSAEAFIKEVLLPAQVKHLIVGDDFYFGRGREGDATFLEKRGAHYGFTVETMASMMQEGERISSTRIRHAFSVGNLALAQCLLNHPYFIAGRVVKGDQRGRLLGFPTANIDLHRQVIPVQGVYAVRMKGVSDTELPGVANVGMRPTVGGTRCVLEVHLFDFHQEIYGRQVCVEFCEKLRDEKRFDSLDVLKAQIMKDADQARRYFGV